MSDQLAAALYPNLPATAGDDPPPRSVTPAALPNGAAPAASPARSGDAGERSVAEKLYPNLPAEEGAPRAPERPGDEAAADAEPAEAGSAPGHLVEQFNTLAREAGLSPDRSKTLMDLHQKALTETAEKFWNQQSTTWERETRRQFGPRLDSAVAVLKPLLADTSLTTPGFRRLLAEYRLGNNPDVVRTLSNWARAMGRRR